MRAALEDPELLGGVLAGESWSTWRTMLIACMGEALNDDELEVFTRFTGRSTSPTERVEEFWGIIGRRGGKDRAASVLATYLGALCDWPSLVPGERGVMVCIGQDQRQAAVQLSYITSAFAQSPMLRRLVASTSADTVTLVSGISIEVRAAHFRRLRGLTAIGVVATECAFWPSDDQSSNPDSEIINAVRPALSTTNGPMIFISSPHARKGELWETYRRHFGPDGDAAILVAQGASTSFNPLLSPRVVARAMERDAAVARAEYLAEFRTDVESYISREAVDACVADGVREREPEPNVRYAGFTDPSGGARDSFTAAVAHRDKDGIAVLDAVREVRAPFSPEAVVTEFAAFFASYGIRRITGDRYGGQWPLEAFKNAGITYEASTLTKSEIYVESLPLINSARVELLDDERLISQLCALERRVARGGKSTVDHPPNGSDDRVNAACGALVAVAGRRRRGMMHTIDLDEPLPYLMRMGQRFGGGW